MVDMRLHLIAYLDNLCYANLLWDLEGGFRLVCLRLMAVHVLSHDLIELHAIDRRRIPTPTVCLEIQSEVQTHG